MSSPGFQPELAPKVPAMTGGMSYSNNPQHTEALLKIKALLSMVATTCGFALAEALCPREDGTCLIQSGAAWFRDFGAELFHRYSMDLLFPVNVGIPGRCWTSRQAQFHADVTILPPTIFLRAEMALKANLRGCVAVPLVVAGTNKLFVVLFFTDGVIRTEDFVRKTIEVVRVALQQNIMPPPLGIPKPLDPAVVATQASRAEDGPPMSQSRCFDPHISRNQRMTRFLRWCTIVLLNVRHLVAAFRIMSWLKCEAVLNKAPEHRTNDDIEDVVKFTRKLDFFKHMPEASRELLCRQMKLVSKPPGTVLVRFRDEEDMQTWGICVSGRLSVVSTESLSEYAVWYFECGHTFSRSYLNLFVRPNVVDARIETVSAVKYLKVRIPPELQHEFRVWTRPLWYEELAKYFHVSINEAAELLGICPSAIKRICRRHGLNRWPHRRISSIDRVIGSIESKMRTEAVEGDTSSTMMNLRREQMDAVRQKMLSCCNLGNAGSNPGDPLKLPRAGDLVDDEEGQGADGSDSRIARAKSADDGISSAPMMSLYTPSHGAVPAGRPGTPDATATAPPAELLPSFPPQGQQHVMMAMIMQQQAHEQHEQQQGLWNRTPSFAAESPRSGWGGSMASAPQSPMDVQQQQQQQQLQQQQQQQQQQPMHGMDLESHNKFQWSNHGVVAGDSNLLYSQDGGGGGGGGEMWGFAQSAPVVSRQDSLQWDRDGVNATQNMFGQLGQIGAMQGHVNVHGNAGQWPQAGWDGGLWQQQQQQQLHQQQVQQLHQGQLHRQHQEQQHHQDQAAGREQQQQQQHLMHTPSNIIPEQPSVTIVGCTVPESFKQALRTWNQKRIAAGELPLKFEIYP